MESKELQCPYCQGTGEMPAHPVARAHVEVDAEEYREEVEKAKVAERNRRKSWFPWRIRIERV